MTDDRTLAATLQLWRKRLTPDQVGLPARQPRRAAGLRREELAELSGLSVDYLVRLEQGRATSPSAQVVAGLARALQLPPPERDHLYLLAGLQPPPDRRISDVISPGVHRLLSRLGDVAVSVFAADWRQVWWNARWAALLGDPADVAPEDRNFAGARFPVPGGRAQVAAWPVHVSRQPVSDQALVADLRWASARYPSDARIDELVTRLLHGNPEFATLWRLGVVGQHTEDLKTIDHPLLGAVEVECSVLTVSDTDLKIVALTETAEGCTASVLAGTR
ncbi:helix-turn-helix transcriptional regulator [Deinococcus altitudinis]|uniref:helix-turn-helix transcriptional regulator n=1 Tax=Deinococcus altitudinis TaxID=468914 RepID=UPI003891DFE5